MSPNLRSIFLIALVVFYNWDEQGFRFDVADSLLGYLLSHLETPAAAHKFATKAISKQATRVIRLSMTLLRRQSQRVASVHEHCH